MSVTSRLLALLTFLAAQNATAQCDPFLRKPLSARPANYDIRVTLDDATHIITAEQSIRFVNQSPAPIRELRMYLYLNAFKNTESSFLKGTGQIFGQGYTDRTAEEWGWTHISDIRRADGADLSGQMRHIQLDDGNTADQSVLEVPLDRVIAPGDTAVFHLKWQARMPRTIARAGHSKDFYLFCHWFPQLGVWEQDGSGNWGWNCHQFFRSTEFYADFGVYDVHITTADKFVLGASGCLVSEKNNSDGTTTRHYHAEDVIDFAWSIYPRFTVQEDRYARQSPPGGEVFIRLLIAPEHAAMAPRYLHALKFALAYMEQHVGPYPYPSLTVVDPPFHGLRSGLMEYPTLITVGTCYGLPTGIRTSESLVVHEFVHQYFMGMIASNEKEEPWLDEGFVTYFEDRIIDASVAHLEGVPHVDVSEKGSLVDVFGYRFGNRELTRLEYTTMRNPREGTVARPGWKFTESNFKPLIYSKTATALRTVQGLVGEEKMDSILRTYFEQWKFRHPRGRDFMALLQRELALGQDSTFARQVYGLFETAIYGTAVLDYAVTHISNDAQPAPQGVFGEKPAEFAHRNGSEQSVRRSRVQVQRMGDWVFPVELLVTFEGGSTQTLYWSGEEGAKTFEFEGRSPVLSAQLDPQQKIGLDVDLNNNSLTLRPDSAPLWKYTAKAIFWVQNLMQTASFLM